MRRLAHIPLASLAALVLAMTAQAPVAAQSVDAFWLTETDAETFVLAQRGAISARDAVNAAQRRYPGSRPIDTFAVYSNGQIREYVVMLATADGRRAFVRVDASTGRVIGECASRQACGG